MCRMSLTTEVQSAESTRRRILDVALELFARQGFAATSTREISERLGFTKAALYYHFHTKDDLLSALVAPVVGELTGVLREHRGESVDDGVRRAVLADYLAVIIDHRQLLGVLVQDPSATGRPALQSGREFYLRLTEVLVAPGRPVPAERARVRFVLGGMHAAVLFSEPGEDLVAVGEAVLAAGCAALGLDQGS